MNRYNYKYLLEYQKAKARTGEDVANEIIKKELKNLIYDKRGMIKIKRR